MVIAFQHSNTIKVRAHFYRALILEINSHPHILGDWGPGGLRPVVTNILIESHSACTCGWHSRSYGESYFILGFLFMLFHSS